MTDRQPDPAVNQPAALPEPDNLREDVERAGTDRAGSGGTTGDRPGDPGGTLGTGGAREADQ